MQERIYDKAASAARQQLGEELFEAARREGSALSMVQAISFALDAAGRGEALRDHAS